MTINILMGRSFLGVRLPDVYGGKHVLAPAWGLNKASQVGAESGR